MEMLRESQADSAGRVRDARQALARLTEVRAQRLREERAKAHEAHAAEHKHKAHHAPDQIEISDRARIMAREHEPATANHGDEPARAGRVAELKKLHHQGRINSPEAIDRAAEKLIRHHE